MARNPTRTGTGIGAGEVPPIEPLDPEEIRQRRLLEEAVLVSFSATPNPVPPFKRATLAWDVTMPSSSIPGIRVEVHVFDGLVDQDVDAKGSRVIAPLADTTCSLYLRTPLATRELGKLPVTIDFGSCKLMGYPQIGAVIKLEAEKPFPPGGQVSIRGTGASVDLGINSFVVDLPLEADVPNWFNADIDIYLSFHVHANGGDVWVTHEAARTTISFGVLSGLLSSGCTAAVAKALEAQSDGFLAFVGPVVADRITAELRRLREVYLDQLDEESSPKLFQPAKRLHNYRMYDVSVTAGGTDFRFCPVRETAEEDHPTPGEGGIEPVHM